MSQLAAPTKMEVLKRNPFLDGPGEFLCKTIVEELLKVTQFRLVFGDYIDGYPRVDYPARAFPVMRVYNERVTKTSESWFIDGDVTADLIWPAEIRRVETQLLQDMVAGAMFQQFRRPKFFTAVRAEVPGLNILGHQIVVDKSKGFQTSEESPVYPVTSYLIDFRIDLRVWDKYLEQSDRTKDDPFEVTLGDLETIIGSIEGMRDDNTTVEVTEPVRIEIGKGS